MIEKAPAVLVAVTLMAHVVLAQNTSKPAPKADQPKGEVKPNPETQKLVRQLGSQAFAEREAADKALAGMGARAAAAVRTGMGDPDREIARRCVALWPRLWQAEIARPDADRLAGYTHPLWERFRKVAGDDAGNPLSR